MSVALYINILSIFIVMLVIVIFLAKYEFKQQRAEKIRRALLTKIHSLRLSKMLLFLGVDIPKFVKKIPPKNIVNLIRTCQACRNTQICDSCLRDNKPVKSLCFCPNFKTLTKQSKTLYEG